MTSPHVQQPQIKVPKRSSREMRNTILNDYVIYLQKNNFDIKITDDPITVITPQIMEVEINTKTKKTIE